MQGITKWKSRSSYLLIVILMILLLAITLYISHLRIQQIQQDIPVVGDVISPPSFHQSIIKQLSF